MNETEAQDILLGVDYTRQHLVWERLAAECNMRMVYIGTCPRCLGPLRFNETPSIFVANCSKCAELVDRFNAHVAAIKARLEGSVPARATGAE